MAEENDEIMIEDTAIPVDDLSYKEDSDYGTEGIIPFIMGKYKNT